MNIQTTIFVVSFGTIFMILAYILLISRLDSINYLPIEKSGGRNLAIFFLILLYQSLIFMTIDLLIILIRLFFIYLKTKKFHIVKHNLVRLFITLPIGGFLLIYLDVGNQIIFPNVFIVFIINFSLFLIKVAIFVDNHIVIDKASNTFLLKIKIGKDRVNWSKNLDEIGGIIIRDRYGNNWSINNNMASLSFLNSEMELITIQDDNTIYNNIRNVSILEIALDFSHFMGPSFVFVKIEDRKIGFDTLNQYNLTDVNSLIKELNSKKKQLLNQINE